MDQEDTKRQVQEEVARQVKKYQEQAERDKQEAERLKQEAIEAAEREKKEAIQVAEQAKESEKRAREETEKAREETEKAREVAHQATMKVQKTNLLEFLDAVHVHLSRNIHVESNPAWTTQGGITDPTGKLCPKTFRRWEDFDERQSRRWANVVKTSDEFSSARTFKSIHFFEEQGPEIYRNKIGSEKSLEYIERLTLETHVESLLEHLSICDLMADKLGLCGGIVFENHENTLSNDYDETEQRIAELKFTTPVKQPINSRAKRLRPQGASHPDAFCVYRRNDQKQVPLAAVELKPPHKLPIPMLLAGMRDMDPLTEVVNRPTIPEQKEDPKGYFQYRADRLVAAAVTQTFSYMIENGLEYGYLGTGEAFVFLHVREDDPETVYYRLCIPNEEVGGETGWQPDSSQENRLHLTAVAQVSAFCLQAVEKKPRSQTWQDSARALLSTWQVDFEAILQEIPPTERKELISSAYQPSIKAFRKGAFEKTPKVFRSTKPDRKTARSCAPAPGKLRDTANPDSSDSEDDSSGPPPPTPSKPPRPAAANVVNNKPKGTGQERQYCTQRCLMGISNQAEFDKQCPNILTHAQKGTNGYHNLDSQEFLWLMQEQLSKDRDTDCYPLWVQGARGAMFKVTLTSYGYTVAAKATVFPFVTDLKHEAAVYECMRKIQGTYVPACLGGIDLLKPYYYRGVELIHMMFMAWGGKSLGGCGRSLTHKEEDISQMAAECVEGMHALGVLHRDVATRNMLWNEECGRVMFVDFERSVVFETKQKQRQPLGVISGNRKRKQAVAVGDEICESRVGDETAVKPVDGEKRVLFKNRFDKSSGYNHPKAFESEVYHAERAAVDWDI